MALRRLIEADLMRILAWRNAPAVRSGMYSTREITEAEHRAWFSRVERDEGSLWFIYENADGEPRGVVYFTQYQPDNQSSFWGFYAAPDAPPGTGTLLGMDALDRAFGEMALHKLNAEALATNERSLRFHRKLGFRDEGLFRDHHREGERFIDVVRFAMLADEWDRARAVLVEKATAPESASPQ